jgi:two-component SAPR family response regulator
MSCIGGIVERGPAQPGSPDQSRDRNVIQTLGTFRVVVNGTEITRWQAGRGQLLFQYLLTHHGHRVAKHVLIDAIWGDSRAKSPDIALRVAICTLRRVLAQAYAGSRPQVSISSYGSSYALDLDGITVDIEEFERMTSAAARLEAAAEPAAATALNQAAVTLYAGPYLPGCGTNWAAIRRERVKDRMLGALSQLAAEAKRNGDGLAVFELHQKMLEVDPCREESYRELMLWHAAQRQPVRVQNWYHACAEQLRTRLGLDPGSQTRRLLYDAISGCFPGSGERDPS